MLDVTTALGNHSDCPEGLEVFSDRSIYRAVARKMVFEASKALPVIGDPTPAMVEAFGENLGWELRDSARPVVNLWTTFRISRGGEVHLYAVGGVMLMGAGSLGEGDGLVEYGAPGRWSWNAWGRTEGFYQSLTLMFFFPISLSPVGCARW